MGEPICEANFFSARRETQAISRNLAKFCNAAMEKFDHKAVEHNLIRGSLRLQLAHETRRLEKNGKRRVPVIAITADVPIGKKVQDAGSDFDEYLTKPLSLDTLSETVKRWLHEIRCPA